MVKLFFLLYLRMYTMYAVYVHTVLYIIGTQSETEEFTAEETKTRNNFPLPNNFRHITVEIPEKFMRSKRTNVKVDPEEHRIAIKPV